MKRPGRPATLEEIKALNKEVLVPSDIAGYLGCDPYSINCMAKHDPAKLGYPVAMVGTRVKIPKAGFIKWAEGANIDGIIRAVEKRLSSISTI